MENVEIFREFVVQYIKGDDTNDIDQVDEHASEQPEPDGWHQPARKGDDKGQEKNDHAHRAATLNDPGEVHVIQNELYRKLVGMLFGTNVVSEHPGHFFGMVRNHFGYWRTHKHIPFLLGLVQVERIKSEQHEIGGKKFYQKKNYGFILIQRLDTFTGFKITRK